MQHIGPTLSGSSTGTMGHKKKIILVLQRERSNSNLKKGKKNIGMVINFEKIKVLF